MKVRSIWKIIFIVYVCLLLYFVVLKVNGSIDRIMLIKQNRDSGFWNYNLYLFRTIKLYLENITHAYAYINILGNIVPFVPLGLLIPLIFKRFRSLMKAILIFIICIICIETFQFISMLGFFDVDDILLNMIGCIVGYCIYVVLEKIMQ